jgi:hypothetical protein
LIALRVKEQLDHFTKLRKNPLLMLNELKFFLIGGINLLNAIKKNLAQVRNIRLAYESYLSVEVFMCDFKNKE